MRSQSRVRLLVLTFVPAASLLLVAIYLVVPVAKYVVAATKEASKGQLRTLSTGKVIRVTSEQVLALPERTLSLNYRTSLDVLHDRSAVAQEVCDIWRGLQADAERQGVSKAVIWPSRLQIGIWGMREPSTAFEFTKDPSGKWVCARCACEAAGSNSPHEGS